MSAARFHLGWFFEGASPQAWGKPFTGAIGRDWMRPDFSEDVARTLERARFDYVLIEDSSYVADVWGGSMKIYLENAIATPRQDPAVVANLMLQATSRIGIVPTLATFAYPPYILARLVGTLDQVSNGRAGWNMVTGSSTRAAQNFGLADQAEHDKRYDMADEYMQVVNGLWDSWSPSSIRADLETGIFADADEVHTIDFEGEYYSVRGPLNSGPLPQGRPAIAQAGGSPRGRQFAAQYANTIVTDAKGIDAMKAYRDDVRARMASLGRNPDDCKVLFLVNPVIGRTERDAQERLAEREAAAVDEAEIVLAHFSKVTNIDFSVLGLDAVLGEQELTTNGHQQSLDQFISANRGKTLREAAVGSLGANGAVPFVGTPETIAAQMDEVMQEVGGDGFLFYSGELNRKTLAEVADGLVPALQRRGLTRTEYSHERFTDNLLDF
ncbi:NtaA/DmoA family FMN-dependent monooxygenase [Herbiconiux moechotypicola]|uniref:NtaA/DmoA family FMN-dependent monooxygenase n=1 Tax=Herbiconiux moechotypicola TaxID=637393 RepID=A0ABP5QFI7_9MICO|nr:NtaA/DmoA family FMN-dependent monooxygenase [Herbiconiux moechotypicola]MCS5729998.1 NtaA/DmoA family FMN-dependent monooxygenase [Herbiconiux moechotypicola]